MRMPWYDQPGADERLLEWVAEFVARQAHRGQVDKLGAAYIEHPARIAAAVEAGGGSSTQVAIAWLHDVAEDTDVGLDDLRVVFPPEVVEGVDAITKRKGEAKVDYYRRVRANVDALIVKAEDINDNLLPWRTAQLPNEVRERLAAKYAAARDALGLTGL